MLLLRLACVSDLPSPAELARLLRDERDGDVDLAAPAPIAGARSAPAARRPAGPVAPQTAAAAG